MTTLHVPTPADTAHEQTVLLIDDIPLFRCALGEHVSRSAGLRWLGATPDCRTALALVHRHHPNIVVLDSVLDPFGELIRLLVRCHMHIAIVVLLREPHVTAQHITNILSAGAHGVLPRSASPGALLSGIQETHTTRRYLDPTLAQRIRDSTRTLRAYPLTTREHETLQYAAEGRENRDIAIAMGITVETVRSHMKNVLHKLKAHNRAHAVAIASQLGLRLAPTPQHATPIVPPNLCYTEQRQPA